MAHISINKLTIIGSDIGFSPGRRHVIIWTNDGILWIGSFRTHFSEILIEIYIFSVQKMHFVRKLAAILSRPQCVKNGVSIILESGRDGWLYLFICSVRSKRICSTRILSCTSPTPSILSRVHDSHCPIIPPPPSHHVSMIVTVRWSHPLHPITCPW